MSRRLPREAMVGHGGAIVVPNSESEMLRDIGNMLARVAGTPSDQQILRRIRDTVDALHDQVKEGYHRNPSSRLYEPFKIVGVIGRDVHSVAYKHAKDGKPYKHNFERGSAEVVAVERHGKRELLITSPDGVPLWDEF